MKVNPTCKHISKNIKANVNNVIIYQKVSPISYNIQQYFKFYKNSYFGRIP